MRALTIYLSEEQQLSDWMRREIRGKLSKRYKLTHLSEDMGVNYAKLYRFLSIEMSLPREERMTPADLLKYVKTEYDRLSEISPLVPPKITELFRERFSDKKYENISRPEESNGLHAIEIYKDSTTTPLQTPIVNPIHLTIRDVQEHSNTTE
jgi:hypothetical protein